MNKQAYSQIPLFFPVILGIGILYGVYFPFLSKNALFLLIGLALFKKFKILFFALIGIYVSQTGGIFKTDLLVDKQFLTHQVNNVSFTATVTWIDEKHPTMKNMQRINVKDIKFNNPIRVNYSIHLAKQLNFNEITNDSFCILYSPKICNLTSVKTAQLTCSHKIAKNILPGDTIKIFGQLNPLKQAIIPGAFDQRQFCTLNNIDTTGIAFSIKKISSSKNKSIFYLRKILAQNIIDKVGQPEGGIASAIVTGDKSTIQPDIRESFIKSGTAHLLAISGLHMTLVSSILYFIFFKIMLYISHFILPINPKIIAAIITILLTSLYLAISGFSPSATRAFIMTIIAILGLVLDRGVFSMRNVALAAFLILLISPGSLFSVSFQLSFSAVVALIAYYNHTLINKKPIKSCYIDNCKRSKFIYYLYSLILTTIIATIATAPISIATFNRFSLVGILGNIIAIPLFLFVIVPLGLICLFGGYHFQLLLYLLKKSIYFLIIAIKYIANFPLSDLAVKSPHISTLYLIIIGGLVFCLCLTKIRFIGLISVFIGIVLWICEPTPVEIFLPEQKILCCIKNGTLYIDSKYNNRKSAIAIQNNLGISNRAKQTLQAPTFTGFLMSNRKVYSVESSKHPYCPVYFTG